MSTMLYRQYEETLDAISFLQDRLYNTRVGNQESRQEHLVNQAYVMIQESRDSFESQRSDVHDKTAVLKVATSLHHNAELAVSLQSARSELTFSQTRLQTEITDHQQTQAHLHTATKHLDDEIAQYQQAEEHIKRLEYLLRQEIDEHARAKIQVSQHEVLLREIHHRIKNNMTMAISLIQIQMGKLHAEEDRVLFRELEHRMYTMALIHEKLYKSQYASSINLRLFVADLSQTLLSAYQPQSGQITFKMIVDDVYLQLDKAIPCGLILNELLTNAMKHAFPNDRKGTISVFGEQQANAYVLTIQDDGIGLPEDFDRNTLSTLGMRLVTLLAQTMGTIRLEHTHGTTFIIAISMDVLQPDEP